MKMTSGWCDFGSPIHQPILSGFPGIFNSKRRILPFPVFTIVRKSAGKTDLHFPRFSGRATLKSSSIRVFARIQNMKRLIVNADDFGLTCGVNLGIVRAFKEGIVTSATIMANGEAFAHAVEQANANPALQIGCHLAAVGGTPVAKEDSALADENGLLPKTLSQLVIKIARGKVRTGDIEREFAAQVERVFAAGLKPTHFDTHKHTAVHPTITKALARTANAYGICCVRFPFERTGGNFSATTQANRHIYFKQRFIALATLPNAATFKRVMGKYQLRTPDYFCGVALTGLLDSQAIIKIIKALREGVTELMCHPSLYDEELEKAQTRLKRERERELEALIDARVKQCLLEEKVELSSYAEL
jgi:chitin disaccharide deacetylase